MSTTTGECNLGGCVVDLSDPTTYFEMTAWVSGPKKDGAVLRKLTGKVACAHCIQAARDGQDPGAADLFEIVKVEPPVDKSHTNYRVGWLMGFRGTEILSDDLSREFAAGYKAGSEIREYLDGYFFFQEN